MDVIGKIDILKRVLAWETEVEWRDREDVSGEISIFSRTPFAFSEPAMRSWKKKVGDPTPNGVGGTFPIGDQIAFKIDEVNRIWTIYTRFADGRIEELRKLEVKRSESRSPEDIRFFAELNKIYRQGEAGKMGLSYWVKWFDGDIGGQFFALSFILHPRDLERDEDYHRLIDRADSIAKILREPAQRGLDFARAAKLPVGVAQRMAEFLGASIPGRDSGVVKGI